MTTHLSVVVYGNGDMYRELFNAIAASMSTSSYHYLIDMVILLTGTWAIVHFSIERSFKSLVRWLGLYYLAFFICFYPKATVHVIDRINPGSGYTIDNVPIGLAWSANLTSVIGDGLTQILESTFSLPDDLHYAKTGMVMSARLAEASTQFQVTDPTFNQSLQSYVTQCIFYDLLLNKYSWNELLNTPDIWNFTNQYASPARSFMHYKIGGAEIITCKNGATMMANDWKAAINDATTHYANRLFPQAKDAKATLLSYLPISYRFLSNVSASGQEIITQNLMLNAFQNGILKMGASTNSPAALAAYSFTKAQEQKRLNQETIGDMAAYWLPIMRNVLTAILYGAFVITWLLILFPFGTQILKHYLGTLIWLQLWAPLYAILNLFITYYGQHVCKGIAGNLNNLTLLNQAGFAQANADVSSLAGYISISVPFIAGGIMKGLMSTFNQVSQYMGGVTQNTASSGAAEAVSGNVSLGNMNYSNQSAFNTSANHFDTSARVNSGMYSTQTAGGSTLSMTADGTQIMNNQGAISSLGTSVNLADTLKASYMQQAEHAESTAINHAQAIVNTSNSGMRNLFDLSKHQAHSVANGESWAVSNNAQTSHAMSEIHRLTDKFAHDHNMSYDEAASVLGSAYSNSSANLGIDTKGSAIGRAISMTTGAHAGLNNAEGYRHDATHSDSTRNANNYAAAEDYIRDTNLAHNVDIAKRAVQDHSYRTGDDAGSRQVESMAASFDQAQSARHEMLSSLQQAENFRQNASYVQEKAASINSNASQVVFESLQKQGMSAGEIENMMTHHPEEAQHRAKQAIQSYANSLASHWEHHLPASGEAIHHAAEQHNKTVLDATKITEPENNAIKQHYEENKSSINQSTKKLPLKSEEEIDKSAKHATEKQLADNQTGVDYQHNAIDKKGDVLKQKVQSEQSKKRHSNTLVDFFAGIDKKEH